MPSYLTSRDIFLSAVSIADSNSTRLIHSDRFGFVFNYGTDGAYLKVDEEYINDDFGRSLGTFDLFPGEERDTPNLKITKIDDFKLSETEYST